MGCVCHKVRWIRGHLPRSPGRAPPDSARCGSNRTPTRGRAACFPACPLASAKVQPPRCNPYASTQQRAPAPVCSPAARRGRTLYHPNPNPFSPREVANQEPGGLAIVQVHVPSSVSDLTLCKEKLGWFLEDPSTFPEGVDPLALTYDLTGGDLQIVLPPLLHR